MKVLRCVVFLGAGIGVLAATAIPAIAGHGKAGLWDVTVTMDAAGMPDLSKLPPEAQAAMKAHGMSMNGNTMTVQHCMTQAEVDSDGPPPMRNQKHCQMTNVRSSGNSFTADMACSGEVAATGHFDVTFDSPEHYVGKTTFSGVAEGHPMNNVTSFEGRWVGADCKGVTH